jgi:hypothetical protein
MSRTAICLILLLVAISGDVAGDARAADHPPHLRLLVPAYFYPADRGLEDLDRLIAAAARVPIVAVINPASGPGQEADPVYTRLLDRAKKQHALTLIGYVDTDYGKRPAARVKADVARWVRLYPQVQGIFFDQQASGADRVDHYAALYAEVRNHRSLRLVVSNPGTACAEPYLARPATDVACLFEGPEGLRSFRPPAWAPQYEPARFAALSYRVTKAEQMRKYLDEALQKRLGYVYITDAAGANPWERLPRYWDDEVAAVLQLSRRP